MTKTVNLYSKNKKSILVILNVVYNEGQFDRSLTSKILNSIIDYFRFHFVLYVGKNSSPVFPRDIPFNVVPFVHSNPLKKLFNFAYIYYNNFIQIKKSKDDIIWISTTARMHSSFIFLYGLFFPKRNFYIQLYTLSVDKNKIKRFLLNKILQFNLRFFNHVFVANENMRKKLSIPERKVIKANIGYPDYGFKPKDYSDLKLIYLGTLHQRDVWKTVYGLKIFLEKNPAFISKIKYNIIGNGKPEDIVRLKASIIETKLSDIITYHGPLPTETVKEFIQSSNIGIAFVPLVDYYQNSSTKTLEYLIAGLPVIATRKEFCVNIVKEEYGSLCEDTPESFANALEDICSKVQFFVPKDIREKHLTFSMDSIIRNEFVPQLLRVINE